MKLYDCIKAELAEYEGTWILPDDLDALAELCEAVIRRAQGGEWRRGGGAGVEYKLEIVSNGKGHKAQTLQGEEKS